MIKFINILFISAIVFLLAVPALPQTFRLEGQLSGWTIVNPDQSLETQAGFRYIPAVSLKKAISENYSIDAEISLNMFGNGLIHSSDDIETNSNLKPYRMWLRFSSNQFELRAGLQKINFGSASILRPLMWFDRIDPRDPLQLTTGVYGLLGRYYFLNNANIWLWGLYGNDETKGWEVIPSDEKQIEFGGRLQAPLFTGEIAVCYHHRQADLKKGLLGKFPLAEKTTPENRFGLDGKWDIGIGIWFEGVLIHQDVDSSQLRYQRLTNFGLDYTFGLGNGLNVMGEYFTLASTEKVFSAGDAISFSAVSLNYPLSLLDNLTTMIYYDWENYSWYRFINWQRTYDRWSFYLMGFWNPDQFQIYQNQAETNFFTGKGFQLMVVLNH